MHDDMLELMHRILDGDDGAVERARLEAHTARCEACARAWDALKSLHATLEKEPAVEAPVQLSAAIMQRLAREYGGAPVRWEGARLAAAFALLAFVPGVIFVTAVGLGALGVDWKSSLSSFLALVEWGTAWTAVLSALARAALAVIGTGPLLVSVLLSLLALAVWAYVLDAGAASMRLNGGGGSQ